MASTAMRPLVRSTRSNLLVISCIVRSFRGTWCEPAPAVTCPLVAEGFDVVAVDLRAPRLEPLSRVRRLAVHDRLRGTGGGARRLPAAQVALRGLVGLRQREHGAERTGNRA